MWRRQKRAQTSAGHVIWALSEFFTFFSLHIFCYLCFILYLGCNLPNTPLGVAWIMEITKKGPSACRMHCLYVSRLSSK